MCVCDGGGGGEEGAGGGPMKNVKSKRFKTLYCDGVVWKMCFRIQNFFKQ